ncbi:MAG: cell division protein FtsQ [Bacteroidetes bacterium QH_1_61_8]|nr:MAG: cell division protein FtsQ [Bacteroidetes bacterium QH_1_61_8]
MNYDRVKTYGHLALRLFGLAAVVGGVLVLGLLGWQWQTTVEVERITVAGTTHAPADTVRHLTRVDSGTVMEAIDASLVADRVSRHPWIERADVTKKRARRTLHVTVTERVPAALAIDAQGDPAYYLDRHGYAMPLPHSTSYDVPLVRGLGAAYHPVQQLAPPFLRDVFSALDATDTDALVDAIVVEPDSSVRLVTAPVGDYGALPVRLGTGNVVPKLRHLRVFAQQVLATQSDNKIAEIDLRFDGQIVTRKHPLDG